MDLASKITNMLAQTISGYSTYGSAHYGYHHISSISNEKQAANILRTGQKKQDVHNKLKE